MSDRHDNATDTRPERHPTGTRLPGDRLTGVMSVPAAAAALGVSDNAIRQRLKRGTLARAAGFGPDGEVLVDLSVRRSPRKPATDRRTTQPTTDRQTGDTQPAADERAVRLAALEAELTAAHHQNAFLTDQLELRRLEGERKDETIATQAAALGEAMEMLRAMRATTAPAQLVEMVMPAEDVPQTAPEPPGRADAPAADDHPAGGPVAAVGRFLRSLLSP